MTVPRRRRPARRLLCGAALLSLLAGSLAAAAIVVTDGRATAGTTGASPGVYVTTGTGGETELPLDNLGAGGQAFLGGKPSAISATAINATATFGVAARTPPPGATVTAPSVDIFDIPGDGLVGSVTGFPRGPAVAGFAMDPQDPGLAYTLTSDGRIWSFGVGPGAHSPTPVAVAPSVGSAGCTSIAVTPDASDVVVGCSSSVELVSLSGQPDSVWTSGSPGYTTTDLAVAPDGQAVYAVATGDGSSLLVGLALPFATATGAGEWGPVTLTNPIAVANAMTVSRDSQTLYVGGDSGGTAGPAVESFDAASGTALSSATLALASLTGVALSPDGSTVLAAGQAAAPGTAVGSICPVATAGLAPGPVCGSLGPGPPVGPEDIAVTPDQAPVAHLPAASGTAGVPLTLDASSSTVAYGPITSYRWDFGDGSAPVTTASPAASHTYPAAGSYTAVVTETDGAGGSTPPAPFVTGAVNGPGTTPYVDASSSARASAAVLIAPAGHPTTTISRPRKAAPPGTPVLTLQPPVGAPGTIVTVTGHGFPPNRPVVVSWSTGTGSFTEVSDAHGALAPHQIFVLIPDVLGPRYAVGTAFGSAATAKAPFLVVPGDAEPGGRSGEVLFRSEGP